jgi:hypothetical protein
MSYGYTDLGDKYSDIIEEYGPMVKAIAEQYKDPIKQQAVLDARIANTQKLLRALPPALRGPLKSRLRVLQARRVSTEPQVKKQEEAETSLRTYRTLGQIGIVTGILLLLALTVRASR